MGDEPDLDPEITNEFFQQYILKFDPSLLTESGMMWVWREHFEEDKDLSKIIF